MIKFIILAFIILAILWFRNGLKKIKEITPDTEKFFLKESQRGWCVNHEYGTLKVMKLIENKKIKEIKLPQEIREKYSIRYFRDLIEYLVENNFFKIENDTYIITNKGLEYYSLRKNFLIDLEKGWTMTPQEWKSMTEEWDEENKKYKN